MNYNLIKHGSIVKTLFFYRIPSILPLLKKINLRFSRFFVALSLLTLFYFPLVCKFLSQTHLLFFGPKKLWNTFLFLFALEIFGMPLFVPFCFWKVLEHLSLLLFALKKFWSLCLFFFYPEKV